MIKAGTLITFNVTDGAVGTFEALVDFSKQDVAAGYLAAQAALNARLASFGFPPQPPGPGSFVIWLLDNKYITQPVNATVWQFTTNNDFDAFEVTPPE